MKETTIYFNLKCTGSTSIKDKSEEIEFKIMLSEDGEVDGASFNPVLGWTGYTQFDQGWSEQDEELNQLIGAIKDYSQSPEIDEMIFETLPEDEGKIYKTTQYCDSYCDSDDYNFEITIQNIECEYSHS